MWIPKKIVLENFKTFEYQEFLFVKGAFLIQGINKTDEGQLSNGSGKSALRESLNYVLDLPIFVDRTTDLINHNNGAKSCSVEFSLKNELLNQELTILRTTPLKGSSTLVIKLNDVDQKDKFATVPEGNKLIIELLGISKEDLINHYIISKEKYKSFFSSSDTQVKELIGRFSNFNRIDGVEDIVEADANELLGDSRLAESNHSKLEGKLELLKEQLEEEKNIDLDLMKGVKIDAINKKIENYNESILEKETNIDAANEKVKEYNQQIIIEKAVLKTQEEEITKLEEINFDSEIKSLKESKQEFVDKEKQIAIDEFALNDSLKSFNLFKLEVETTIEGAIKCPKCLYEFIPNDEISVEEAKKTLPQVLEEIDKINISLIESKKKWIITSGCIDDLNVRLNGYEVKITEFNNHKRSLVKKKNIKEDDINSLNRKVETENLNISSYKESIERVNTSIKESEKEFERAKKEEITTREKEIKIQIDSLVEEIEIQGKKVQRIKDNIFDIEQWIIRFKKFKSSLANESLEIIQGYANMYLQKMNTNISLQLEGYKTLKDGKIREKITPIILKNGIQKGSGSLKKLSGGERVRVDFATSVLALQNLINNSSPTGGLSLLFVDEILESIDSVGLENLVSSLNGLNNYCYIVSHTSHEKVYENILTIEKVNNISRIV